MISKELQEKLAELIAFTSEKIHETIPEIRKNQSDKEQWIYDYLDSIYNFEIPDKFESGRNFEHALVEISIDMKEEIKSVDDFNAVLYSPDRVFEAFLWLSSYAIITKPWLRDMAVILKDKKVLEVACGNGMLAKGLRDEGINVIATNHDTSINDGYSIFVSRPWINDIEIIDAVEAVYKYGKDVDYIILSWPPYDDKLDLNVLKAMRKVNPNCILIIIGEEMGECTGSIDFYNHARSAVPKRLEMFANLKFKNRMAVHDCVQFYK